MSLTVDFGFWRYGLRLRFSAILAHSSRERHPSARPERRGGEIPMTFYVFAPPLLSNLYAVRSHIPAEFGSPEGRPPFGVRRQIQGGRKQEMDAVVLAMGIGFFALMFGYAGACDRL